MFKGFREFIMRGNVIDLAVAVVIGAALLAVVAVRFVREWKEEARRELERQAEEAEKTEEATDE